MLKITGLVLPYGYGVDELKAACAARLSIDKSLVDKVVRLKENLITDGSEAKFKVCAAVSFYGENTYVLHRRDKDISLYSEPQYKIKKAISKERPVVVGFGPAGIFAALTLAEAGLRPIVLERGQDIDARTATVTRFTDGGDFDGESNIQFGEGGAGTFSDGKLKPGTIDGRKFKILSEFIKGGAPEEIAYSDLPHIGTDKLRIVIKAIREKIILLGGEVRFSSKLTEVILKDGRVTAVKYEKDGETRELAASDIILSTGHSARDTFEMLKYCGVNFRQKNFGIGVRIEHPQTLINKLIYGEAADKISRAASYHLVSHISDCRTVYSFCMCPGGYVMAATGEEGAVVTNGMSEYRRDGKNANSALLVSVNERDLASDDAFTGIELQRRIEKAAFAAAGSNYHAPIQLLGDFFNGRESKDLGEVLPSYKPGTEFVPLRAYLPEFITEALRAGICDMSEWMKGYYFGDAVLTGPETRSTSPVCIPRTENCEAVGFSGLYPCGEGAGYSGGIISSAVDGMICAEAIIGKYENNSQKLLT